MAVCRLLEGVVVNGIIDCPIAYQSGGVSAFLRFLAMLLEVGMYFALAFLVYEVILSWLLVGDLSQLQHIHGGEYMREFLLAEAMTLVEMEQHIYARTQDPILLDFLHTIRSTQPSRGQLRAFFGDRYLGRNLITAVRKCRSMRRVDETPVTWLTCTNRGAMEVNYEYLRQLGYGTKEFIATRSDAYACDIDYGGAPMIVRPGMWLRLTRNLDKKRGFCNGAMGQVIHVLRSQADGVMFTMRLTHGAMVVVHPIRLGDNCFLPCVYGYAMTTRKAQGSSTDYAVLYFDLFRPASRGYAYVGASRVRHHTGLYYFGKIRRSDWLSPLSLNGRGFLFSKIYPYFQNNFIRNQAVFDDGASIFDLLF